MVNGSLRWSALINFLNRPGDSIGAAGRPSLFQVKGARDASVVRPRRVSTTGRKLLLSPAVGRLSQRPPRRRACSAAEAAVADDFSGSPGGLRPGSAVVRLRQGVAAALFAALEVLVANALPTLEATPLLVRSDRRAREGWSSPLIDEYSQRDALGHTP